MGLPSCSRTAPSPLSDVSHCRVTPFVVSKYLRTGALVTSCFTCWTALSWRLVQDHSTSGSVNFQWGSLTSVVETRSGNFWIQWTFVHWPHLLGLASWHHQDNLDLCWICCKTVFRDQMTQERNFFLTLFSLIFCSRYLCISERRFQSWSTSASSSVEPSPKTRMSSWMVRTPFKPPRVWFSLRWNSSGAVQSPKGRQRQQNRRKGELEVVRHELSLSSSTCQNPFLASTVENTFALESSGSTWSMVGVGLWLLLNTRFRSLGSMHTQICPLGFCTVTYKTWNPWGYQGSEDAPVLPSVYPWALQELSLAHEPLA